MSLPRVGEFDVAINGLFAFDPRDFTAQASYFGLYLSDTYVMAHLRDSEGRQIHVVRPLGAETSPGMAVSSEREDGIHSDPRGGDFMRGGYLHRHLVDDAIALDGLGGTWSGGSSQSYAIRVGQTGTWQDSGLLDLTGTLMGPGTQLYLPWRENGVSGGTAHCGLFYQVEGSLFGEPVSGTLIVDHIYSPAGQTLHGSPLRRRFLGAWNAFATTFEDGSVQYGQFGYGAGAFRYANIVDGDRHFSCAVVGVTPEYGPDGMATRLEYRLANGETWEWAIDPRGTLQTMTRAAAAQGANCQVHKGHVSRVGDTRARKNWYSIIEWFPDRIVDDPSDVEMALPAGF